MRIKQIISGGQTGADRGGLDAAIEMGIPYGGRIPKGRYAEDGKVPDKYENMVETVSAGYPERTNLNVMLSCITLIFCHGDLNGGSLLTRGICWRNKKPFVSIDLDKPFEECVKKIVSLSEGITENVILNVAGSRESKHKGIQQEVKNVMVEVIKQLNGEKK
jgi:hypothetical protein